MNVLNLDRRDWKRVIVYCTYGSQKAELDLDTLANAIEESVKEKILSTQGSPNETLSPDQSTG